MLTSIQNNLLFHIRDVGWQGRKEFTPLREGAEKEPFIVDLIGKGYVQLVEVLCGPLGVKTGEKGLILTEAGRIAMLADEKD